MGRSWALAASALVVLAAPLGAQEPAPGEPAPDIRLPTLAGREISLAALRGRSVLEVLAVNLRDQEARGRDVERFVAQFRLAFPVLVDQRGRVRRRYQLAGVPTSVFIDAGGVVRVVHPGPITQEALLRGLAAILPAP